MFSLSVQKKGLFSVQNVLFLKSVFPQGVVRDVHCVRGNQEAKSNQPHANMCLSHIMRIVR